MIRCKTEQGTVKVTFSVPVEATGDRVTVVGDFNGWDPSATPMRKRGDARSASVVVEPGRRYGFRYFDGSRWFNDEEADAYEDNGLGDQNSVVDLTNGASPKVLVG